jgi:fumarate hydratase subunit alpha
MLEVGQDVHWIGGSLQEAVYEGVREGTRSGYLRWSVTGDPTRMLKLSGQETPAVIHLELVPGADVKITFASKGFGAENMSALKMFVPADGVPAITQFVLDTVDRAGADACPPIIVGVGVGGTFEAAALLAKKAVLRPIGVRNPGPDLRQLEVHLLERVNDLGIGPQGFGGRVTALGVNVISIRDAIAARLADAVGARQQLPISLQNQILYAVGPSPAKPGQIIGSAARRPRPEWPDFFLRFSRPAREPSSARASCTATK